jgi:hypothetical protein
MKTLICNHCKSYHYPDIYKCGCGCKTFSETHPSNAEFIVESPRNIYKQESNKEVVERFEQLTRQ